MWTMHTFSTFYKDAQYPDNGIYSRNIVLDYYDEESCNYPKQARL